MPIDRQTIEKRDFPIGRRGYDPDAVDAHLALIAREVEELKAASRRRSETVASSASGQVRAIVEAAESSAAEIQRQAEDEAAEIRAEALGEAQSTRQQASAAARDYVGKVSESTSVMLQRLDAMEAELSTLVDSLRTGATRLGADLQLLDGNFEDVQAAVMPRPQFEPEEPAAPVVAEVSASSSDELPSHDAEPEAPAPIAAGLEFAPTPVTIIAAEFEEHVVVTESAAAPPATGEPAVAEPAAGGDDEGARLVALNMALNGTSREETDRYLAENFALSDRERLLDEVFALLAG